MPAIAPAASCSAARLSLGRPLDLRTGLTAGVPFSTGCYCCFATIHSLCRRAQNPRLHEARIPCFSCGGKRGKAFRKLGVTVKFR
jgi:hypothetical protein